LIVNPRKLFERNVRYSVIEKNQNNINEQIHIYPFKLLKHIGKSDRKRFIINIVCLLMAIVIELISYM